MRVSEMGTLFVVPINPKNLDPKPYTLHPKP